VSLTPEIAPDPVISELGEKRPRFVSAVVEEKVISESNSSKIKLLLPSFNQSSQSEEKGLSFYFKKQSAENPRDYPEEGSNHALVQ
jgi:hypothetical protein